MILPALACLMVGGQAFAPRSTTIDVSIEHRVDDLLGRMTIEEKIDMLSGREGFYTHAIPRLNIPAIKMSDGPAGVRNYGATTAYAAPVCLAATWDRDLAYEVGKAFARDARARGVHTLLAPAVNINRVSVNGRNFEYLGEDPFLAAETCVPYIRGLQESGVMATVKHFAANNQEFERTTGSSDVDERTLREIYFPAFEAAVKRGGVWAVMCSYNLVNGVYASENDWLQNRVLKQEWGFRGLIMSDWGATHSAVGAANGGLDLEMPGGDWFVRSKLLPAIQSEKISIATIDDKVRRILRAFASLGFLDRDQKVATLPLESDANAAVALREAREGIVLLKNDRKLLPLLSKPKMRIAVIGPNAHPAVVGGGGSAQTQPFRAISVLDAIKRRVGAGSVVTWSPGPVSDPDAAFASSMFRTPDGSPGLRGEYFPNKTLDGPAVSRVDSTVNFDWGAGPPGAGGPSDGFSARWTGSFEATSTAKVRLFARGDDGYRVFVDGRKVIDEWRDQGSHLAMTVLQLAKGRHDVKVEYYENGGQAEMRFGWSLEPDDPFGDIARAARQAEVAVVCVGFKPTTEGEGFDRSFAMPDDQDRLVEAVVQANPNTIVVLNSGAAVDKRRWVGKARAVLQAWYPGQNGNTALAEILFGDVNPSGKLPASFERRWEDAAAFGNYPGTNHHVRYAEGIFVGYRHFDRNRIEPMFPFGHGLSYSTFRYRNLRIEKRPGNACRVRFDVTNTSRRRGAEVAQLYVQDVKSSVPRPPKELKGFARLELEPGMTKSVSIDLDDRAFAFWDVKSRGWRVEPGEFKLLVGASSRDMRLSGRVVLGGP